MDPQLLTTMGACTNTRTAVVAVLLLLLPLAGLLLLLLLLLGLTSASMPTAFLFLELPGSACTIPQQ